MKVAQCIRDPIYNNGGSTCYVILIQKKTYVHTFIFWIGIPVGLVLLVAEEQEEDRKMGTSYL